MVVTLSVAHVRVEYIPMNRTESNFSIPMLFVWVRLHGVCSAIYHRRDFFDDVLASETG